MTEIEDTAPGTIDRLEALKQHIRETIERVGWYAMGVFPTADSPPDRRYGFTYSIGLARRGWPDLIVVRLQPEVAHAVIESAIDVMEQGGPLEPATRYSDILVGYDVLTREPSPNAVAEHFGWAGWYYRERESPGFKALQIVWPDRDGNFPGEADYDAATYDQPLL